MQGHAASWLGQLEATIVLRNGTILVLLEWSVRSSGASRERWVYDCGVMFCAVFA